MSGQNIDLSILGPGIFRDTTEYATGSKWFDGNQVRWHNNSLTPIGGWIRWYDDQANVSNKQIRDAFSWRDYNKVPALALGSADNLVTIVITQDLGNPSNTIKTYYDITPDDLVSSVEPRHGFGAGLFGSGLFGAETSVAVDPDAEGQWSMDNWGRTLLAVHNQDGRLFQWDPFNPLVDAEPVLNAPDQNSLVITTDEEFCMLFGGRGNPNRIQWCSRRNINDWTATEANSAGGFELQSQGSIIAAQKVQGGILVLTGTDVHIVEYVGPPNYYARRRLTNESGIISKNAIASMGNGALWVGKDEFWVYDGNVSRFPCSVHSDVFAESNFSLPSRCFMGINEGHDEIWFFYPHIGSNKPDQYVAYSFGNIPYCTVGKDMVRTFFHTPVFSKVPLAALDRIIYQHETGWLADGVSRNGQVYAVSGALELGGGDKLMRVDRFYQDNSRAYVGDVNSGPLPYTVTFELRNSPNAAPRTVGPVTLDATKGYTQVRFRARQAALRVDQVVDGNWSLGKPRLRARPGGGR